MGARVVFCVMTGQTASHTSRWIMRRRVLAVMAMLVFAAVLVPSAFGASAQLSGTVSVTQLGTASVAVFDREVLVVDADSLHDAV